MTSLALPSSTLTAVRRPRLQLLLAGGMALLALVIAAAMVRQVALGRPLLPARHAVWLTVHLVSVIPAVPLGAWLLWSRKGDGRHRLLGRIWGGLMVVAALSSFGLRHTGHLSWIHLLACVTLAGVLRGTWLAIRGQVAAHRTAMTRVYLGLLGAGAFAFLPGRLLGQWLFG